MIIQNISDAGRTDLTFTVPRARPRSARSISIKRALPEMAEQGIKTDDGIAKVSVVGVGMRSHAGVALRMFEILAREGINILMISTSEIKISVRGRGQVRRAGGARAPRRLRPRQAAPPSNFLARR